MDQETQDQAFYDFMVEKWYYIVSEDGLTTSTNTDPAFLKQHTIDSITAEWHKIKKEKFGTITNAKQEWKSTRKRKTS